MNRRMRNRMYGGVRGRRGRPRLLLDLVLVRPELARHGLFIGIGPCGHG